MCTKRLVEVMLLAALFIIFPNRKQMSIGRMIGELRCIYVMEPYSSIKPGGMTQTQQFGKNNIY